MSKPGGIDPILAFLDFLEGYRRSWRCWLIGGPAAVDDLAVEGCAQSAGVHLRIELEYDADGAGSLFLYEPAWHDVVPAVAEQRRVAAMVADAGEREGQHITLAGSSVEELLAKAEGAHALDEGTLFRLQCTCRQSLERVGFRLTRRLRHRRLEARLVHTACAGVRLGGWPGQFWAAGTGASFHGGLVGLEGQPLLLLLLGCMAAANGAVWSHIFGVLWGLALTVPLLARLACNSQLRAKTASLPGALGAFVKHLRERRRAERPPLIVILGPDRRQSALLFSLFAHLAGHAQLADPAQGGALEDDDYTGLASLLDDDPPAPAVSSTYRVRFGPGVGGNGPHGCVRRIATGAFDASPRRGGPPRARVVHMVCPEDGDLDELHRRVLGRADQVWLVLPPAETAPELAQAVGRMAACIPERAGVTLVGGAPGDAAAALEPMAGRRCRSWGVDLGALRSRYLAGRVSAEEAGEIVGWLASGAVAAPPLPRQEGGLPDDLSLPEPREAPGTEPRERPGQAAA